MTQYAMPILIINLGGEMLYILEQRLQAQNIPPEKSKRVLQDVVRTMFSEKFVTELIKPQPIYSSSSTRQIFHRLAHSSIMRLNANSMDKLYDLMTMGFKYQVVACTQASDLLQISINHLDVLRNLVGPLDPVAKLITKTIQSMIKIYENWLLSDWMVLRQLLCDFLQDRRIKVSLFLQDGLQNHDGTIFLSHVGKATRGAEIPGTIRYFQNGALSYEDKVVLGNSEGVELNVEAKQDGNTELGTNIYARERAKKARALAQEREGNKEKLARAQKAANEAAKAELNLLAGLIGASKESDYFSINLFADTTLESGPSDAKEKTVRSQVIEFNAEDADTRTKRITEAIGDFNLDEDDDQHDEEIERDESDDLLALMEQANRA